MEDSGEGLFIVHFENRSCRCLLFLLLFKLLGQQESSYVQFWKVRFYSVNNCGFLRVDVAHDVALGKVWIT